MVLARFPSETVVQCRGFSLKEAVYDVVGAYIGNFPNTPHVGSDGYETVVGIVLD